MAFLRSLPTRSHLALARLRENDDGQALVEYALVVFLVAAVCVSILTAVGSHLSALYKTIASSL